MEELFNGLLLDDLIIKKVLAGAIGKYLACHNQLLIAFIALRGFLRFVIVEHKAHGRLRNTSLSLFVN